MKIVLMHDNYPPMSFGGGGISVQNLAYGMRDLGHEVSVVTTCRHAADSGEFDDQGVSVYRLKSSYHPRWRWYVSLYNPQTVHKIEEIFKLVRPDVVNISSVHEHLSYHSFKLAKKYTKAVVFTARDVMTFNFSKLETEKYLKTLDAHTTWRDHIKQAGKRYNPLRNIIIKKYLKYADRVVVISKALKKALLDNGISATDVIYNAINVGDWSVGESDGKQFKEKFDLVDKKVVLYSGRLSASKGAGSVLRALELINQEMPEVVLLVAGTGQMESGKNVVFTGWLDKEDIKLAYGASDVVLMPSVCFDSFGRVNIEAMAMHKPVVGTCFGGTPEVVEDGVTGYIVNPLYPEEIAQKTLELLKNPSKATEFGNAGYDRVRKYFDVSAVVARTLDLYKSLI